MDAIQVFLHLDSDFVMSLKNLCFATWPRFFPLISIKHLRVLLVVLYLVQEMIWIINSWKPKCYILAGEEKQINNYTK